MPDARIPVMGLGASDFIREVVLRPDGQPAGTIAWLCRTPVLAGEWSCPEGQEWDADFAEHEIMLVLGGWIEFEPVGAAKMRLEPNDTVSFPVGARGVFRVSDDLRVWVVVL